MLTVVYLSQILLLTSKPDQEYLLLKRKHNHTVDEQGRSERGKMSMRGKIGTLYLNIISRQG